MSAKKTVSRNVAIALGTICIVLIALSEEEKKKAAAIERAQEWGDHIPIGTFYKNELEPTFIDRIVNRIPFYRSNPAVKQKIKDENGFSTADLKDFFEELRTS